MTYRPSQVNLHGSFPPLCATMKRSEREAAAALLVRSLAARGDQFRAITRQELGEVIVADLEAEREPWRSVGRNPFFRPDFCDLVKAGYARWVGADAIEFTAEGVEAMRRWVVP